VRGQAAVSRKAYNPREPAMFRIGRILIVLVGVAAAMHAATAAAAQSPPDASQLWVPAAEIHEIKNQFVAAIRQLAEGLAGRLGDEGRRLPSIIDTLDRVRAQWDESIRRYEAALTGTAETAEGHVALGTVYLDRHRIGDALREFAAAGRLDSRRADVHRLAALAFALDKRFGEAADALRRADTLDGDPITSYARAQYLILSGRQDEAVPVLRTFHQSLQSRVIASDGSVQSSAPFERASLLRQVSGVAPIFPLETYRNGFSLLLTGSYDRAVAEIRRAAAEDPIVVESGQAGDSVAEAATALRRGQMPLALRTLESAVAAGPNRLEAHRILGVAYWADGRFDESIAQFRAAIRLSPRDERSRLALADVLVEAGQVVEAEHVLEETIALLPDSGGAHYRLGQAFQALSLLPRAVQEFEVAAALDPLVGVDRLYETIGGLYSNQASFDAVVGAYVKRIDANPNHADGHMKLGEIYFLQGRDDEALAEFFAALLIDPSNSGALAGAGQVFSRAGRHAEAVELSRRALARDPGHKGARYALATSLMRLGQPEDGKRELEAFQRMQAEAIARARRESELKALKLDAARRRGDGDLPGAAALLRRALAYDSNDASLLGDLAAALIGSGQSAQAIATLEQALTLSDSPDIHQLLADAYKSAGRLPESEAQLALSTRARERMKEERLLKISGSR
jgi:tetratricopeptide (TPR) repeat protein